MNKAFFNNMQKQMNPSEKAVDELYKKIESLPKAGTKINKKFWILGTAAAACLIISLTVAMPRLLNQNHPASSSKTASNREEAAAPTASENNSKAVVSQAITASTEEIAEVPHWNDLTVAEKYIELERGGVKYSATGNKLNNSEIDKFLYNETVSGLDLYSNKQHTINSSVYSIKSISTKCAVAVKYEGHEGYYTFDCSYYSPATLGDLINDLNLRENLVFNKIYYSFWKDNIVSNGNYTTMEYTLPDTSVIWDLLLADTTAKNNGDEHYSVSSMGISIDVKIIGAKNISLSVNDDGYLQTNILNTGKSFFIGKEKVQGFIDYVLTNGTGAVYGAGVGSEEPVLE